MLSTFRREKAESESLRKLEKTWNSVNIKEKRSVRKSHKERSTFEKDMAILSGWRVILSNQYFWSIKRSVYGHEISITQGRWDYADN